MKVVTYDFTLPAARTLAGLNTDLTFVYVSGAGTSETGRAMWSRVKARTENAVLGLFPNGYAFRPGFIQPMYGARSRTRLYRVAYVVMRPLLPVLRRLFPRQVTTTEHVGRLMLEVARHGHGKRILEPADLAG